MRNFVLLVALFLGLSATAHAACTRADLTGTWVVYTSGAYSYAERCQMIIPAKGNNVPGTCLRADGVVGNGTLTIASFDSTCHLIGTVFDGVSTANVDSFVSKGKDSMSGMWLEQVGQNLYSGSFNGSKQ